MNLLRAPSSQEFILSGKLDVAILEAARKNLHFLVAAGILPDPHGQIRKAADEPETAPVLPASSAVEPLPRARPTYRRAVRTGSDPDASRVGKSTVQTTVEELTEKPRPDDMLPAISQMPAYQNRRAEGVETTLWQLDADIIDYNLSTGGDYVLVLQGPMGRTMRAACPDPDPRFVDP